MDLDTRLEVVIRKRNDLAAKKQRVEGQYDAAQEALLKIEEDCRSNNIDPASLEATVAKLETRYAELVEDLERDVSSAAEALAPFLKEN